MGDIIMNTKKIFGTLAVMTMVLGGAGFADAYNGQHHRGYAAQEYYGDYHNFGNCPYGQYSGAGKQLSEKEWAEFSKLRQAHWEKMQPLHDDLRAKHLELNALKYNPNVDPETLIKLSKDISNLENKIDAERDAFRAQVKNDFGIEYYGGGRGYGRHHRMGRSCY